MEQCRYQGGSSSYAAPNANAKVCHADSAGEPGRTTGNAATAAGTAMQEGEDRIDVERRRALAAANPGEPIWVTALDDDTL
ncbi:hypothetical protein SEA_RIPARIAN_54 [Mycobacterium phage Riparian]|uniref:Uncharacterized protein n=1 Tax=Mycobacterium phage Riparian TaxID=2341079 RepID=A0A3G3LWZ8_9CAUD|nr:hypothetical protein SEA_RIPARIAN_54 [Mycobacterium phage Riparian]